MPQSSAAPADGFPQTVPSLAAYRHFKKAVQHPFAMRIVIGSMVAVPLIGAGSFATLWYGAAVSPVVRDTLWAVIAAILLIGVRVFWHQAWRPYFRRAQRAGVLCVSSPVDADVRAVTGCTAILLDARLSDAAAAHVHGLMAAWVSRAAADGATEADVFGNARVRAGEDLFGVQGRGAFLLHGDDADARWRLLLPETDAGGRGAPFSRATVLTVAHSAAT